MTVDGKMILTQPSPLPCYMVNSLTTNSLEQCKFIVDNDCLEDEATVDYVYLVYCEFGYELRYASILLITFLVIVLFLALSAVADEFLCPSLLAVAKSLRMSDSLAGVTLLAFGNGCPDIFSSLAAASGDRSELIVGELLGAGIFCTSIVAGLIFIHSDFKIACRPILRDTTFYLLTVYLIWFYCWGETITFYGSLAFIIIYVIYLIVALSGQAIHSRLLGDYAIAETQAQHDKSKEKEENENWFKWREESIRRKQLAEKEKKLENTALTNGKIQQKDGVTTIHLGSSSYQTNIDANSASVTAFEIYPVTNTKFKPDGSYVNKSFINTEKLDSVHRDGTGRPSNKLEQSSLTIKQASIHQHQYDANRQQYQQTPDKFSPQSLECNDLTSNEWDDFLSHINPVDSDHWCETNFTRKIIGIVRAPLLFAAIITIPVVDHDKRNKNWCRLLNSIHCITVPLAITLLYQLGADNNISLLGLPLPVLVLIPGVILAGFVLKTTSPIKAPKYQPAFAYFGFMMSILWIYMLATEIIGLLKTVGIMFSMTDTAIGLGILAWGNSLGDIVANISLAEAGYPRMALGASIGAPLLNLLLGFGLSFTISLKPGESSTIEYSPTITLLCSTLAIILISLMLSTLAPPEKSKKPFGYALICSYGCYFALAVCLEYGIIKF